MPDNERPILIATRGSALALAQANFILVECRAAFPKLHFELKIIKTSGDKLQTASLAHEGENLPKGLFTKELEVALLKGEADLAVHSLKDLPTDLPKGLKLGATTKRADMRDALICRNGTSAGLGKSKLAITDLPRNATVATSSTRRRAQLLAQRADLKVIDIRGNVGTRLQRLADRPKIDALVLAAAGMNRLNFQITSDGQPSGDGVPAGLVVTLIDTKVMLPCVGQAAIGLEIRENDERIAAICERLNHFDTFQCVTAERAFLAAMGGGCASPMAAHAEIAGQHISMKAVSFLDGPACRAEAKAEIKDAVALGKQLATQLKKKVGSVLI